MLNHVLKVNPDELAKTATQLDQLATELEANLLKEEPNLAVVAAGSDEVSVAISQSFNDSAAHYLTSARKTVTELREMAAELRSRSAEYVTVDGASAQLQRSI